MSEEELRTIFTLAGITALRVWKLPNGYLGELEPLTDEDVDKDTPGTSGMVKSGGPVTEGVVRRWMSEYRWRVERPAWLVKTPFGLIQITQRKRVTDIEWSDTPVRAIVTGDDTTKDNTRVHAWSQDKILEYLKLWATHAGVA